MALITTIKQDSKTRTENIKNNLLSGEAYLNYIKDKLMDSLKPKYFGIKLQLGGTIDNELIIEYDSYDINFIILDIPVLKSLIPSLDTINFNNTKNMLYVYFNYENPDHTPINNMTFKSEVPMNNNTKTSAKGRLEFRIMVKNNNLIPNFNKNCQFISNNIIDFLFIDSFNYKERSCRSYNVGNDLKKLPPIKEFIELYKHHLFNKNNKYSFEDSSFDFGFIKNDDEFIEKMLKELGVKKEQLR